MIVDLSVYAYRRRCVAAATAVTAVAAIVVFVADVVVLVVATVVAAAVVVVDAVIVVVAAAIVVVTVVATTVAAAATTAAIAELRKVVGASEKITWDAIVNPAHDVFDLVKIVRSPSGIDAVLMLDAISIPLAATSTMNAVGRLRRF